MSVERYLEKGIKEIMNEFPEIEHILEDFSIGCADCGEGSCLLKDIVDIHELEEDEKEELMIRISNAIFPDRELQLPIKKSHPVKRRVISYSPPMKKMVEEHVLIKRWIALIPKVIENIDLKSEGGLETIHRGIDFIRNYADKYHHAKEEEQAFLYFDENFEMIQVIKKDHVKVRSHVKKMLEAIDEKDKEKLAEHLNAYSEILPEHIKKEDEILFPWMDRNLSITQVGELYSKFNEIDENYGDSPRKYLEFIEELESAFKV